MSLLLKLKTVVLAVCLLDISKTNQKVEYVMEISYDDDGNEAEIKTNNEDGTDSFGRLLEASYALDGKI